MKFEKDIKRLEEIVASLEKGEPDLEKALALFSEGTELIKRANTVLDKAEQQVTILTKSADGELIEGAFEEK